MLVEVVHPYPSIATSVAAFLFGLMFRIPVGSKLWLLFATVLLTQFSISALNDWADRDADAQAGRARPIATGRISAGAALVLATAFGLLSLLLGTLLGPVSAVLVLVGLSCGWAYDLVLKRTVLSFVPFAIAFPLLVVWVALVAQRPIHHLPLLLVGGIAFAIAVHLADIIPDRHVDAQAGLRTLALILRYPTAEIMAGLLLSVGVAVTYVSIFLANHFVWPMLSPAVLVLLYFLNSLSRSSRDPKLARQLAKWVLVADAALCGCLLVLFVSYD